MYEELTNIWPFENNVRKLLGNITEFRLRNTSSKLFDNMR